MSQPQHNISNINHSPTRQKINAQQQLSALSSANETLFYVNCWQRINNKSQTLFRPPDKSA